MMPIAPTSLPTAAPHATTTIKPTVGRVLYYFPKHWRPGEQPLAAIIAHVVSDELINIAYFSAVGGVHSEQHVRLVQAGRPKPGGGHCEWMPYQVGQARSTEILEKGLKAQAGMYADRNTTAQGGNG